jgi:hypothetical protein
MTKRPAKPSELPDALRDAVERTVDATLGSAGRSREAAQGALDDLVGTVDELRRGAEERISRRLDAIEERLPPKRSRSTGTRKPATRRPRQRSS